MFKVEGSRFRVEWFRVQVPGCSEVHGGERTMYRGTLLIRNVLRLGPYSRPVPRALR